MPMLLSKDGNLADRYRGGAMGMFDVCFIYSESRFLRAFAVSSTERGSVERESKIRGGRSRSLCFSYIVRL